MTRRLVVFVSLLTLLAPNGARAQARWWLGAALCLVSPLQSAPYPDVPDCTRREITKRTVRLVMERGGCTATLVAPRVLRTAGRCFTEVGSFVRIETADHQPRAAAITEIHRADDPIDQAELRTDRDLVDGPALEITRPSANDADPFVTWAGFLSDGALSPSRAIVALDGPYAFAPLPSRTFRLKNLSGPSGPVSLGGPVFKSTACQLALVGTVTRAGASEVRVQMIFPFVPEAPPAP